MGLASSLQRSLQGQSRNETCLPMVPYTSCSNGINTLSDHGLVLKIKALPKTLERATVDQTTIWWTDVQFLPCSDCQLVVSTTPYQVRVGQTWLGHKLIPRGRILVYDISKHPTGCVHFKGTFSSALPRVHPHPFGHFIAYIESSSGVKVINFQNEDVYRQPQSLNGSCKHAALAPNGINFATIFRSQGFYFIRLYDFDKSGPLHSEDSLKCHKLCQGFYADRSFRDQVEVKWSWDSRHLAVCSFGAGVGKLFIFDTKKHNNICTICPDLIEGGNSSPCSYDFDPREDTNVIAVGTVNDDVCIIDFRQSQILQTLAMEIDGSINCVQYNATASLLAVGFANVEIKLLNPDTGELIYSIDAKDDDAMLTEFIPCYDSLSIMRLSFNFTGSLLAAGMCDGFVRVWQIPCMPSLQVFCKLALLRLIPQGRVKDLLIPEKIKLFLRAP